MLKTDDQNWRKNVKRSIYKLFYFVAALPFLSSTASAKEECVTEKKAPAATKEIEMVSGYNASSRIDVNGAWDVFVNGSYILWQPRQSGLGIAESIPTLATNRASEVQMDFDFHSGFKVAIGTNLNHDNWMAAVEYTRLHCHDHASSTVDGVTHFLSANWLLSTTPSFVSTDGHWKFEYDVLDLSFIRPCYVGTHLTFKPYFGLRGGWIDQNLNAQYFLAVTNQESTSHNKSDTWMIGPRAGIGMNWFLGKGFRLLAHAAGSLLYQEFENSHSEVINTLTVTNVSFKDENHQVTPNVEGDLGFGWGTYFDNSNWHFDLLASYHFEVYWSQNDMRRIRDELVTTDFAKPGTLGLQGLTITAQLDF